MMVRVLSVLLLLAAFKASTIEQVMDVFSEVYESELGSIRSCQMVQDKGFKVCSDALRNDGNAPFILHHGKQTDKVVLLFHGLSDSPFFFRSIAEAFHQQGNNVVVALLPGHGKKNANADMQDSQLKKRWHLHVNRLVEVAMPLGKQMVIGGFSTGGALSIHHVLYQETDVAGVMLFSGALRLQENAEKMAKIWGSKWLAKILDGDYQTDGPNPYKYPSVASYAALVLMDVIFEIREKLEQGQQLTMPIYAVHSAADQTTPIGGVEALLESGTADNTFFVIAEELDVCHADVVVSATQLIEMNFDKSRIEKPEPCSIPKSNPVHPQMLATALNFLANLE